MTDLSGDGGVMKKILKEGEGECPPKGNQVVAHYTGTSSLSNRDFRRFFQCDKFVQVRSRTEPSSIRVWIVMSRSSSNWDRAW